MPPFKLTTRFGKRRDNFYRSTSPKTLTLMWQSYLFGMHWKHEGKLYYDELPAAN